MPVPNFTSPSLFPALYLYPLNDSFVPKHISLLSNQHVKIGRQTNAKTVPGERNGYFDSKVLSRQHAEVWEDNGKIYIKDVKSSNGTFINGERLSPEGLESEPFELKTSDVVEFGIDIVGEDNKTIIHHKVAARVVCVYTEQEAQEAARLETQQNPAGYGNLTSAGSSMNANNNGNAFNFANGNQNGGQQGVQRRSTLQQGLQGMGGMGGGVRQPGKSGLTFDHILTRLQGELQKSRETGAELHSLTGAMNDIHETLGGNLPPNLAPYPQTLPPVVPSQTEQVPSTSSSAPAPSASEPAPALSELQAQLHETQQSLANHVEKIRALEGMLAEHEAIKREVSSMREMMEERKREMAMLRAHQREPSHDRNRPEDLEGEDMSDDDDTRSIATITPHELERVEEEDEEQMAAEEEEDRRRRRDELGRPRTPEPTGMGMDDDEHDHARQTDDSRPRLQIRSSSPISAPPAAQDELAKRLDTLAIQLESALELSRSLEAQHATAQSTISLLESKVTSLETLVQSTQVQVQAQGETQHELVQAAEIARAEAQQQHPSVTEEERARERESLTEMLNDWKKNVEGRWSGVHEEWNDERERLRRAKEEWEIRVQAVENGLGSAISKLETGLASMTSFQSQHQQLNGHAKMGNGGNGALVTPPSPRSLSADSNRPRQRKKKQSSSRGRSHSRSRSSSPVSMPMAQTTSSDSSMSQGNHSPSSFKDLNGRTKLWVVDDLDDSEEVKADVEEQKVMRAIQFPPTPESSLIDQPLSNVVTEAPAKDPFGDPNRIRHMSFASVLVLGIAAAVLWRTKSDGAL